jgi:copper oxidase (laccase) domain-containing protein
LIADHARALGVRHITTSASCTRCDNDRFFSHRAGDGGRQLGVMIADG